MTDTVHLNLRAPTVADGPLLWQMAADSATLDANAPYAYLLWCRDFAATFGDRIFRRPPGRVPHRLPPTRPARDGIAEPA